MTQSSEKHAKGKAYMQLEVATAGIFGETWNMSLLDNNPKEPA